MVVRALVEASKLEQLEDTVAKLDTLAAERSLVAAAGHIQVEAEEHTVARVEEGILAYNRIGVLPGKYLE